MGRSIPSLDVLVRSALYNMAEEITNLAKVLRHGVMVGNRETPSFLVVF